jgi:hypothetical protein
MTDVNGANEAIEKLKRETAELSGLALATGVILTQLLQSMCQREMNPQGAATKIITNARSAIEAFTASSSLQDPVMKARAIEAVKQYEDQIRSALRD